MSGNPIGDALRADADAAREEIRAAGLICPSCGVNMADLNRHHMLTISDGRTHENGPGRSVLLARQPVTAKCAEGEPVVLHDATGNVVATWETYRNAANIALWDKMQATGEAIFAELMYGGPVPGPSAAGAYEPAPGSTVPAFDGFLKFLGGGHE
jgi:hypothetical protein